MNNNNRRNDDFGGGFSEILNVIKWIFLSLWFLILCSLFIFSLIAFWRWPSIINKLCGSIKCGCNGQALLTALITFQSFLLTHIAVIMFDIFRFPFILLSYVSFTRRAYIHEHLFHSSYSACYDEPRLNLAKSWIFFFKQSMLNIIGILLFLLCKESVIHLIID